MAGILSPCYKSLHEPYAKKLIAIILALHNGRINRQDFRKYVLYLDNTKQLEFNSSFLNTWQLGILKDEFPDTKFILMVRDCYSWLNAFINLLRLLEYSRVPSEDRRFLDVLFGKGPYQYPKEEVFLYENGFYPLDHLLSYWARVSNEALAIVPESRILVVRTAEIGSQTDKIADFLNIPARNLDPTRSHLNKNVQYPNDILFKIDRDYLVSRVNLHCKPLMDRFFPGFIYEDQTV